jgi:hypothetical protein
MNDFSELETELRQLRPLPLSAELLSRVEKALADPAGAEPDNIIRPSRFHINWRSFGVALGAAAVLLIFAHIDLRRPASKTITKALATPASAAPAQVWDDQFIPSDATQVVYDTRDEGLHYSNGSAEPMRRLRSKMRETWAWQNPATGASLRVSYPSEQVELIPVSGQ